MLSLGFDRKDGFFSADSVKRGATDQLVAVKCLSIYLSIYLAATEDLRGLVRRDGAAQSYTEGIF